MWSSSLRTAEVWQVRREGTFCQKGNSLPLQEIVAAFEYYESQKHFGKVCLELTAVGEAAVAIECETEMRSQRSDGRGLLPIGIGIGCGNDDDPEPAAVLATRRQHRRTQRIALPVAQREEKRHLSLFTWASRPMSRSIALGRSGRPGLPSPGRGGNISRLRGPTITLSGLSEIQKRALRIADNKIALNAGWDLEILQLELSELASIDVEIDLTVTGFSTGEIDVILTSAGDPDDEVIPPVPTTPRTKPDDIWILGEHRVGCGDGRDAGFLERVIGHEARIDAAFLDPPYNVRIGGHAVSAIAPRPGCTQARTLGVRPSRLVARRCPQESSDVETFRLPIRPSARFSVLIPDLGGKAMLARQAETEPSGRRWPRMRNMPRCSICTDFMVAPEASVLKTDGEVSYLWSCDRCGHGFVTEARLPRF